MNRWHLFWVCGLGFALGSAAYGEAEVHSGGVGVSEPSSSPKPSLNCIEKLGPEDRNQIVAFRRHLQNISGISDPATLQNQISAFLRESRMSSGAKMAVYALLEQRKDEALKAALSRNPPFARAYENWGQALVKLNSVANPTDEQRAFKDASEQLKARIRVTRFDAAYADINKLIQETLLNRVELTSKLSLQQSDQKIARSELPKILTEFAVTTLATTALAATGVELGAVATGTSAFVKAGKAAEGVRKAWLMTGAFASGAAGFVGISKMAGVNIMAQSTSLTLRTDFACELANAYQKTHVLDDMVASAAMAGGLGLAVAFLPEAAGMLLATSASAAVASQSVGEVGRQMRIAGRASLRKDPDSVRERNAAQVKGGQAAANLFMASQGIEKAVRTGAGPQGAVESAIRQLKPRNVTASISEPLEFAVGERVRFRGPDGIIRGGYFRRSQDGWTVISGRRGNQALIKTENVFRMTGMSKIPRTLRDSSLPLKGSSLTYLNQAARITSQKNFSALPRLEQVKRLSENLPPEGDATLLAAALWESGVPGVRLVRGSGRSWLEVEVPSSKGGGEPYVMDGGTVKSLRESYRAAQRDPNSIDAKLYTLPSRDITNIYAK
ncbi:MAG: hypothetical protein JST16_12480 [Bdellovibrionales bacterium]|nr:hypothetical protein [Bdellovibrionales bacterium]